jgi:hypothetical protein
MKRRADLLISRFRAIYAITPSRYTNEKSPAGYNLASTILIVVQ